MNNRKSPRGYARLVGVASNSDGHTRITSSKNFKLYNGNSETHKQMLNKAMQFMTEVENRGLSMNNISRGECSAILEDIGMSIEDTPAV
jgi:hypothetical protein